MFYNIQTLCDTVCIFSLHLINFKGVIGVPVATARIFFFVLEHGVTRIFRKQVITSFATSSTHNIYIMLQIHSVEHSYGLGGESLRETFTICIMHRSLLAV